MTHTHNTHTHSALLPSEFFSPIGEEKKGLVGQDLGENRTPLSPSSSSAHTTPDHLSDSTLRQKDTPQTSANHSHAPLSGDDRLQGDKSEKWAEEGVNDVDYSSDDEDDDDKDGFVYIDEEQGDGHDDEWDDVAGGKSPERSGKGKNKRSFGALVEGAFQKITSLVINQTFLATREPGEYTIF